LNGVTAGVGLRGTSVSIEIRDVVKTFNGGAALRGVTLDVDNGEFVALLGPSGSGKTTLLRCLAGLEWPNAGSIHLEGNDVTGRGPRERSIGFVFQHYALFRHMTVFENVAFGLRVKKRRHRPTTARITERVTRLLTLVQLEEFANRFPSQLSGGQRQRVALARALAIEPKVLLLDEPFGALDAKVRKELRRWLRRLHDEMGLTSVFVTHDQEEALELADRVAVMRDGRIEQFGGPGDVYHRPASAFVFDFLGSANKIPCRVESGKSVIAGVAFEPTLPPPMRSGAGLAYIRPHDIAIFAAETPSTIAARISSSSVSGPFTRLEVELPSVKGLVEIAVLHQDLPNMSLNRGTPVWVQLQRLQVYSNGCEDRTD
jgi:sulfate/thiosulfate transport system ATP-binding protein